MRSFIVFAALGLALAGCAQLGIQEPALSRGIQASEVDWSRKTGRNTVAGIASLRSGGTVHTCAGQNANLIPDTPYARARLERIFGSTTKGMRPASQGPVKFASDDPLYVSTMRTTRCDASGSFSFPRIPDGVWYATTSVKWGQNEGGSMMQRVEVSGGRLVKVTLP